MAFKYVAVSILLNLFVKGISDVRGQEDCGENRRCLPLSQCDLSTDEDVVFPCDNIGQNVCCSVDFIKSKIVSRTPSFPDNCGNFEEDNRITGGEVAAIGQFPWMALLGYKVKGFDFVQFLCGGTLITQYFVLTAAHCTNLPGFQMTTVRLGEWDLSTEQDCETVHNNKSCAAPYEDIPISKVIPHSTFNSETLKNDIALVRMARKIIFTDLIQPICLPFDMSLRGDTFYGKRFLISGWGKTSSDNLGGSNKLMFAKVVTWNNVRCNKFLPKEVRPITDNQICANGEKRQDSCKGDSGGPLFNNTFVGLTAKTYQYGIVSFAASQLCGNPNLPTVYTRVDFYLDWIVKNVK